MYTPPELAPSIKDVAALLLVRGSSQMRVSLAFWLVSRRRRGKMPHAVLPRPTSHVVFLGSGLAALCSTGGCSDSLVTGSWF